VLPLSSRSPADQFREIKNPVPSLDELDDRSLQHDFLDMKLAED